MNPFFDNLQNMGSMLSDEQKDNLKAIGEKYYGNMDMEKYKPTPKEEAKDDLFSVDYLERVKYQQLCKALDSGLLEDDLTPDELEILKKYSD